VIAVPSFGRRSPDALKEGVATLNVLRAWATGGPNRKTVVGSVATCGRGLRSIPPTFESVCTGWVILDEVRKASLVMQFSSHRMAASYHCFGDLSKERPDVRQAT
jgi:hypothetical protein